MYFPEKKKSEIFIKFLTSTDIMVHHEEKLGLIFFTNINDLK